MRGDFADNLTFAALIAAIGVVVALHADPFPARPAPPPATVVAPPSTLSPLGP